jgi:hypothetical protein
MRNTNSAYSASFTAATMMYNETKVVVQMLLKANTVDTMNMLKEDTRYLQIQSVSARQRVSVELAKRFNTMPPSFWNHYLALPEDQQRLALFYVILKTYKLLFDFQVNLALPKFNSIDRILGLSDVMMAINEIASTDEFVDSWTDNTRKKIASSYITMLKQAGLIDETTGELMPPAIQDEELVPYVQSGDVWFLQACFIPHYRIEKIKQLSV